VNGYVTTIGDGSATSYTVTHNLNSRDLLVQLRDTDSPYEFSNARIEATTVNTVKVSFLTPPATNAVTAICLKVA